MVIPGIGELYPYSPLRPITVRSQTLYPHGKWISLGDGFALSSQTLPARAAPVLSMRVQENQFDSIHHVLPS